MPSLDVVDAQAGRKVTQPQRLCLRVNGPEIDAILEPGNSNGKLARKDGTNDRRPHSLTQVRAEQERIDDWLVCVCACMRVDQARSPGLSIVQ